MGKNSHFGVTSQNIFSQSQKYFNTTFIYSLKNILLNEQSYCTEKIFTI